MAVINNSLQLQDKMTPVLRSIIKALNSTLEAMSSVDQVGSKGFRNMQQAIQQASSAVSEFGTNTRNNAATSTNAMDGLIDKVKQLAAAYISVQGVKMLVGLSDEMSSLNAALGIINEGQRHTANLQEKIRQSAMATGSNYMAVAANVKNLAMMAGNAFASNDEILYFSEQLNKQFAIAGVKGQQAESVMYNLTQALSSGVLRGNDFNILAANMGNFIDGIAKTMGVTRDQMKKMAEEGKITAAMVKKAMYDMAEETDERFKKMPMQWGNIWNNMTTQMLFAVQPLLTRISEIMNSGKFQAFIAAITSAATGLIAILTGAFNVIASVGEFVYDHWALVEPLLYAVGAYGVSVLIPMLWGMATAAWAQVPPLLAAAGAWLAMNWPILAIGLAIGVIIGLIKHFGITAEDVFGAVAGSVMWLGGVFKNIWNYIQEGFWNVIGGIVKGVKWLLEKINGAIGGGLEDKIASLENTAQNMAKKASINAEQRVHLDAQYAKGKRAGTKFASFLKDKIPGAASGAEDFARKNASDFDVSKIEGATKSTADNTKALTEGITLAEEDIELLKETARISFVNRFTTMTPNITASFGDVHETADVKGIMGQIEQSVMDALASSLA